MPTLAELAGNITPIIDTFKADSLRDTPNAVRAAYEPNAERYFASEAMRRVRDTLIKRLTRGERTLGYLIGAYGHGKTAAAIHLWHECEKNDIAAVPPFQFTSFDDLVEAVTGWLRHVVAQRRGDMTVRVDELRDRYRNRSVEQRAVELARRRGLPLDIARTIVAEEIAPNVSIGRAAHVSDFLESAANLAQEAGYKSLLVFADEMQIYLESGDVRENIEDLRRLILALRPSAAPIGLMIVIHERVAMVVQENAGDAMQRMQDDGVALNLGQNLDANFPRDLLKYLCQKAGMKLDDVADEPTLEALGQIALRKDLSNGPRTVAAAIRCIVRHQTETGKRYRIENLVADYEQRRIVFDGVERSLSGALAQILSDDVVRQDKRYGEVIRFLCMFPDGAPERFAKKYGLEHALDELAMQRGLLGTVIYAPRAEHWALKALQLDAKSEDRLTEFVRLFRDNFWYNHSISMRLSYARLAFAKWLLPELMPRRGSGDAGRKFSGHLGANDVLSHDPAEIALVGSYEGTTSRFPERRVGVVVGTDANRLLSYRPAMTDAHILLVFHLKGELQGQRIPDPQSITTANRDPRVDIALDLDISVADINSNHDFPPELQLLRDSIVPRQCTAGVLLNLMYYIEERLPKLAMPEADRQQIREYLLRSARRNVEQMLFPNEVQAIGITVRGRGRQLVESVFEQKLAELYPHYKPLHTGREAQTDLERYESLLKEGGLRLAVKRGQEPVRLATTELLAKMGVVSASQFDATVSRLRGLGLLSTTKEETITQEDSGRRLRTLEFTFTEHPLEQIFRQEIENSGVAWMLRRGGRDRETKRLPHELLRRLAIRQGYLADEFNTVLELARWREWLDADDQYIFLAIPDADPDTLQREAEEISKELKHLAVVDATEARDMQERLTLLTQRLTMASPEALSDLSIELRLFQEQVHTVIRSRVRELDQKRNQVESALHSIARNLPDARLNASLTIAGAIGGKLDDVRRRLLRKISTLKTEVEHMLAGLRTSQNTNAITGGADLARRLQQLRKDVQQAKQFSEQTAILQEYERHFDNWKALALTFRKLEEEVSESASDLSEALATWSDDVVSTFNAATSDSQIDILAMHTQFAPRLDALLAEQAGRAQKLREDFTYFYKLVRDLYSECNLPIPRDPAFDPQNPHRAYDNLSIDAARHLRESLQSLTPSLQEMAARCTFLHEFRNRDVSALSSQLDSIRSRVEEALSCTDEKQVHALRNGQGQLPALCGDYSQALSIRNTLAAQIGALEQSEAPESGLQEQALLLLRRQQRKGDANSGSSVADLFRSISQERQVSASELFDTLRCLYIQGNIELTLRTRH